MTKIIKPKAEKGSADTSRRSFLKNAGVGGASVAASALAAPAVLAQNAPIKWRLQTYSGAPLGAHVIKPQIDAFNKAANGEMEIELYYADQLVPTSELFRALQNGTIDAVQSDDATMASPVDISVFGGGIIPDDDIPRLKEKGVAAIFTPGSTTMEIVKWIEGHITARA